LLAENGEPRSRAWIGLLGVERARVAITRHRALGREQLDSPATCRGTGRELQRLRPPFRATWIGDGHDLDRPVPIIASIRCRPIQPTPRKPTAAS
jgi:hypothetical protein